MRFTINQTRLSWVLKWLKAVLLSMSWQEDVLLEAGATEMLFTVTTGPGQTHLNSLIWCK